jgi:hypothetical protein
VCVPRCPSVDVTELRLVRHVTSALLAWEFIELAAALRDDSFFVATNERRRCRLRPSARCALCYAEPLIASTALSCANNTPAHDHDPQTTQLPPYRHHAVVDGEAHAAAMSLLLTVPRDKVMAMKHQSRRRPTGRSKLSVEMWWSSSSKRDYQHPTGQH